MKAEITDRITRPKVIPSATPSRPVRRSLGKPVDALPEGAMRDAGLFRFDPKTIAQ